MNQFTASLWGDEGFSAILSMHSIPEIIEIIKRDTSPPLYNITEHLAFQAFGTSEVVIRGLSFFYYLLAVFFIYKIGALFWNHKTGLFAAVLTFFNPFFFIYAFEGRMYSIMAFGVAASMYFYLKIVTKTKKKMLWGAMAGHSFFTAWALYSHHFAIFAVMLQGVWFLYELLFGNRKAAISLFISLAGAAVLYSPWLIPLYNQTKMVGGGFWLGKPTTKDYFNLIFDYLAQGIKHPLSKWSLYLVFATLITRKWTTKIKPSLFLLIWFLFPITATWVISQVFQPVFYNRYLLYAIPGATLILSTNQRKIIGPLVLGALLGMFLAIDWHYFNNPTKMLFREFADAVIEVKKGDDYLINWDGGNHKLWESKYYNIPAPIYVRGEGELPFFVGTALMEEGDIIRELPQNARRIGAITAGSVDEVKLSGYTESEPLMVGELKLVWLEKE